MVPSINCKDSGRIADFMTLNAHADIHPLSVFKQQQNMTGKCGSLRWSR